MRSKYWIKQISLGEAKGGQHSDTLWGKMFQGHSLKTGHIAHLKSNGTKWMFKLLIVQWGRPLRSGVVRIG